jgi:1,4-dihydroxy-2-naphthoate octaprenyltransferase
MRIDMNRSPSNIAIWWQAFRYHFVPASFLPAFLGSIIAWAMTGRFYPSYFILTVLGVTINHIALNMTDDYYDFQHSVDRGKNRESNPYSGGSGTLTSGYLSPRQMARAFRIGYLITIGIGLVLVVTRGWQVLFFGVFGVWCAFFYTAPPIRYGYRGFGELSQLINFSLTIGLGAFFVQSQYISWDAMYVLLPLGFMMFAMITINEIPDENDDRTGGKRNLVVIFGREKAVWFYGLSMLSAYLMLIFAPLIGSASFWIYCALATLPWFFKAFWILFNNYHHAAKMSPANMLTIRIHNISGILLCMAYIIHGVEKGMDFRQMVIPIVMLIILYFPVALTIFFNIVTLKPGEIN